MKKILTLLFAVLVSSVAMATDFKDSLYVSFAGNVAKDTATIYLTKQDDGKYTLALYNFKYSGAGIGNIVVTDIDAQTDAENENILLLSTSQEITITAGDDPSVKTWTGPYLGNVPVVINAKQAGDKLYATIDIDMKFMASSISVNVVFGNEDAVITAGVHQATTTTAKGVQIYDLGGRKVNQMQQGLVYIVRQNDGSVKKVMK